MYNNQYITSSSSLESFGYHKNRLARSYSQVPVVNSIQHLELECSYKTCGCASQHLSQLRASFSLLITFVK